MPHKNKEDYNEYLRKYMNKRYKERIAEATAILGGKCAIVGCEYEGGLYEFDHIDPSTKIMAVTKIWSFSKERFLAEVAKCQLLCPNHHYMKTYNIGAVA